MVSFTLKQAGYDVVETSDGVNAMEYARDHSVGLVLMDVNMRECFRQRCANSRIVTIGTRSPRP
jgi:CheY-like chemotaxis protein